MLAGDGFGLGAQLVGEGGEPARAGLTPTRVDSRPTAGVELTNVFENPAHPAGRVLQPAGVTPATAGKPAVLVTVRGGAPTAREHPKRFAEADHTPAHRDAVALAVRKTDTLIGADAALSPCLPTTSAFPSSSGRGSIS